MVTVTYNLITVTVAEKKGSIMTNVKFLEIVGNPSSTHPLQKRFPVMKETKLFWIISYFGDFERKIMKSTGRIVGSKPDSWLFAECSEPQHVTVTETQLDLIPKKRPVGRPKTGKALTPAEKQRRYRERQHNKNITLTVNRDDVSTLSSLLTAAKFYGPRIGVDLDAKSIQRLIDAFDVSCGGITSK